MNGLFVYVTRASWRSDIIDNLGMFVRTLAKRHEMSSLTLVPLREAMNVAVAVCPLLDGKLQRRSPSPTHTSIGWKLQSDRVSSASNVHHQLAVARCVPDSADAAFALTQVNKCAVSGTVEAVEEGFNELCEPVIQIVLRVPEENAPLIVRSLLSNTSSPLDAVSRKVARKTRLNRAPQGHNSKSRERTRATSTEEIVVFAKQLIGKDIIVEGSLRLMPSLNIADGFKHHVPMVIVPRGELMVSLTRR